ncbi:traU family protein [Stutzerimonas xanthomarina]|uniref:TraU family protein n=3 Tax=Stutzerimonas TaxID=2901164 RepID=A0A166HZG7_STUST|nr:MULTISPECIES: TraU family protein [Stutzerimonas]MCH2339047.1 TraU family protein [Pseudomonas sp.]WAD28801.1 TraU family protein [Pseudomonadaceae bacterium T75]KZX60743.1 traU family protein [Stutzerimonas frequens]MBA1306166.1 traU family protein [Stutzerimonas stutzeri]MBH3355461.1 TraU family protein [Stutzerimonas stutzeri]
MRRIKRFLPAIAACLLVIFSLPGTASAADAMCEDSGIFGPKLFTDICWACLFPIKVSGVQITPGTAPAKASKQVFCVCQEGTSGIYKPGIITAMWEPARIVENVRKPGCSPTLGGVTLPLGSKRSYGRLVQDHAKRDDMEDGSFYQTHYYAFPLLQILDLYTPTKCNPDGYLDVDIISFTEIDPTWGNATLAFFQHPESAAVANPVARAACAVESGALAAGKEPLESMWWCSGTWGGIYPLTGHVSAQDFNRTSALISARLLSQQHRRGLARRTMGDENVCTAGIYPTIPKSQYKFAQFWPKAMTQEGMWIGEHPYHWDGGTNRHIPGTLNDSMYMIWRWTDCCSKL